MFLAEYHNIEVLPLTKVVFERVVSEYELQRRGIQAGDSIHVVTAIMNNADILVSTDVDILGLNRVFNNTSGRSIQCMDTDGALLIL